jgi:hypothetical protein
MEAVMPTKGVNISDVLESVAADIRGGFEGILSSGEFVRELNGVTDLGENDVIATALQLVVVPWVYRCTHVGDFLGVPPTYIALELRGTTFVRVLSPDPKGWDYFRYIDYLSALHQLGVTTTSRPALTIKQFENWNNNREPTGREPES